MPDASIVIVTRNRLEKAIKAVESALSQVGNFEIILMDDGSTDGTAERIQLAFPMVRIYRSDNQEGYIVQRSRSASLADAPVIISIDDDAIFADRHVVSRALGMFDHPLIGAVAIPHVNHYSDGRAVTWFPELPEPSQSYVVSSFVGTAYALRTDLFRQLGGFHDDLFHWAEESEYCQRLYGAKYVVRLSNVGLVRHYPEGTGKYTRKVNRYVSRNTLLAAWMNAPFVYLLAVIAIVFARSFYRLRYGVGEFLTAAEGIAMAFAGIFTGRNPRRPIPSRRYKVWMEIRKRKLVLLDEIAEKL